MNSSQGFSDDKKELVTDTLFVRSAIRDVSSESELPAIEDWSSLEITVAGKNQKVSLYQEGLYSPGSGEICGKYLPLSDSSILRHQYFSYPAVSDPGIEKALLNPEPRLIYPDDGQELYLSICKDMDQCPVKMFHRGLLNEVINLSYYCVNPIGFIAMAKALERNRNVKVFDLTENFLNIDACYHLGKMLAENGYLERLILESCRIGPQGVLHIFRFLLQNKTLRALNLNRNIVGDKGVEFIADSMFHGIYIKEIYLSKNDLARPSLLALVNAFEVNNQLTHIDLSWNNLNTPLLSKLLELLKENHHLEHINLAWNSLTGEKIATSLGNVTKAKNLHYLNLEHNKFTGDAVNLIIEHVNKAKKLRTLNLSYNPLTLGNALTVVSKLKLGGVKITALLLDGVTVNKEFMDMKERIHLKKKDIIITHGDLRTVYKAKGVDVREMLLNRVDYLLKASKKKKIDFALVMLQMLENGVEVTDVKTLSAVIAERGALLEESLLFELADAFPGPITRKKGEKKISISLLGDFIERHWPERKLPPKPPTPPPPEPEPETIPEPVVEKKKAGTKKN